ncbi:MAG TPA: HAD-IC family P-type ATPase [Gemmataceae bacterium]|nr:HAD-IC family P-type ATPase [Gemmataceae bacterium]
MSQDIANQTTVSGLTTSEVAQRVARGEINRVRRSDAEEYLAITLRNVFTLFNALVTPAALALFLLHKYPDALAVSGMALTNLVLGLVQEVRAKRHLDGLTLLAETRVRVMRNGQVELIPSGDVVRDDVLLLSAGDTIVADGPVLESRFLEVDEALLTGESDPVPRQPGEPLLSGSFCVAGEGSYHAERVGVESFAQRTAGEARSYRYSASPIQQSINRLLALLTTTAVVLCLGYGMLYALREVSPGDLWEMIAATITSMVPQGLVVMTTFAFVLGAVRMSRRGALVQLLNAVESMASIDTLCMDKTGTLTTNQLHLEKVLFLDTTLPEEAVRARLRLFASASLDRSSKSLAALREALGETPVELLDQLPFKSQNRYSAVRVRSTGETPVPPTGETPVPPQKTTGETLVPPQKTTGETPVPPHKTTGETPVSPHKKTGETPVPPQKTTGETPVPPRKTTGETPVPPTSEHVLVLGACEALRPFLRGPDGWESAWRELLGTGMRLLLFAEAEDELDRKLAGSLEGFALRPLALVALGDELRSETRHVLEALASQGIRFKILSGDHADTVRATVIPLAAGTNAVAVKELAETPVVSGDELQAAADPGELIRARCVFGRVSPAQKVQIVAALKQQGRRVAMIGDGVNDVLPIKNAHLGLAMGDGAAASKTVAGIVLETNRFDLLPETLDEGRTILRNLRRAGKVFLVKNVFTLVLIVGAQGVFGLPFPYKPVQVTLLNFLTIGVPTFLIMLDRERSAAASARHFLREIGLFALRTGIVIGLAGLLMLWLTDRIWQDDTATQRTLLLSLLVLLGLTTLLRALRDGEAQLSPSARRFRFLAAAAFLLYLGALYCRPVGSFFALTPLTLPQWIRVLIIVGGAYLVLRLSDCITTSASTTPGG